MTTPREIIQYPFPSKHMYCIYNFFDYSCILLKGTWADWWTGPFPPPPFQRKILTILVTSWAFALASLHPLWFEAQVAEVGSHPVSPLFLYGIISKRPSVLAAQLLLREKSISLACLVAQWYSYGGSWKWVTILSILVGMVHLLSAICFCISSYVHQQLHSLDC